mmetsp:Transcript_15964/g.36277  ORF Transcript_15964/g.36277 Transcript_15964/m.36277 type:complete len:205 (-) Transcript_15964:834-1448(-)
MLFSRLSIRAMATSQVFSSSSVSKQSCKGLPEKSSLNCSAVSFFKKLTKACPRLPSPFASPGKKRKSKAAPYLLFKVDASFSRVYCVGTPLSMSKVSLEAPGSVDAKVAAGAGGMETGGGNIGIAGKFGGGRMKPVGVVGGMYVGVAGFFASLFVTSKGLREWNFLAIVIQEIRLPIRPVVEFLHELLVTQIFHVLVAALHPRE